MSEVDKSEEKTIYRQCRKEKGLTREAACNCMETMSVDRLERIENGRINPNPDDILELSRCYRAYHLLNYYCSHECNIGKQFIPEVRVKDLSQIVLETLASLNSIDEKKNRLIEITVDGQITGSELEDFIRIKEGLEKISMTIDSLKLWTEQMKASGSINEEEYEKIEQNILKKQQ